jgi:hypothetical protein
MPPSPSARPDTAAPPDAIPEHDDTDRTAPPTPATSGTRRIFAWFSLAFVLETAVLAAAAVALNGGRFVYLLDDAYIHLTLGRNLALEGTFGVVPGVYESASSSPGWTLVLASLLRVLPSSVAEWVPFVVNLAAGVWLMYLLAQAAGWLRDRGNGWLAVTAVCTPLVIAAPTLVLAGMEHVLHAALCVWLLTRFARWADGDRSARSVAVVCAAALLATLFRYETLFLAGGIAVAALVVRWREPHTTLAWRIPRPPALSFLVVGAALVPVVVYGIVNLSFGQYFLPNSVVAKSEFVGFPDSFKISVGPERLVFNFVLDSVAYILVGAVLFRLARGRIGGAGTLGAAVALLVGFVLHVNLSLLFPSPPRYGLYLSSMAVWVLFRSASEVPVTWPRSRVAAAVVVLLIAVVAVQRLVVIPAATPIGSNNIYEQQWRVARFTQQYYDGRGVILNDLGLISWLHDGPVVDTWALGSFPVLKAYRSGDRVNDVVARLAREADAEVMIATSELLPVAAPDGWQLVGRLGLSKPRATSVAIHVNFLAPPGEPAEQLRAQLEALAPQLPAGQNLCLIDDPATDDCRSITGVR